MSIQRIEFIENLFFTSLVAMLFCCSGCEPTVQKGYGRSSGVQYSTSVNGTRVLHEMVEAKGREVKRYGKFSPRWEKYQTVFWIPDSQEPPGEIVVDRIKDWLSLNPYRKLVYVARDYNAAMTYWDQLAKDESIDDAKHEDLRRQFHDEATNYLYDYHQRRRTTCEWFETKSFPYTKATTFSGPMSTNLDTNSVDIRYSSLPQPGDVTESGPFGIYDVDVELSVDGIPFVFSLDQSSSGEVIVVGNASFLTNLSLKDRGNQELADALINRATENLYIGEPVLFIESQYSLPIADRDSPDVPAQWAWITQKPLRFIVPHIFFCSLLFCFVYFPIFGRPRTIKQKTTANFKDHVDAMGQLIKKSKSTTAANGWIEEYKRRNARKSHLEKH